MLNPKRGWPLAISGLLLAFIFCHLTTSAKWTAEFTAPQGTNPSVGKYEKVELGVDLPEEINCAVNAFLDSRKGECWDQNMINWTECNNLDPQKGMLNPFAQEDVNLKAVFTSPTGKTTRRYGFFYRRFVRLNKHTPPAGIPDGYDSWQEVSTDYHWRIRFAPDEIGQWSVNVFLEVPNYNINQQLPTTLFFNVVPSNKKGYVSAVPNRKYLKYEETGESFFGTGENIPSGNFYGMHKNPNQPLGNWCSNYDVLKSFNTEMNRYIDELASAGGKLFRVVLENIGYSPEWEQLGCYDCRQGAAWEFDQILEKVEGLDMYINLWFQGHAEFKNPHPWCGLPLYAWDNHPYKIGLSLTDPKEFFRNADAIHMFKRRLRYIDSRWGYSPHVLSYELLSEANETYPTSDLYASPQLQLEMQDWMREMSDYIRNDLTENRKRHLITTSFAQGYYIQTPGIQYPVWGLPNMDLINIHYYHPFEGTNYITRSNIVDGLWNQYHKPIMFNELGSSHRHRMEAFTDMNQHNNIWATSMMGNYSCGFNWYVYESHMVDRQFYKDLKPLTDFMQGIDLAGFDWTPKKSKSHYPSVANDWIENFYNTNKLTYSDQAFGWAHNRSYYGYNLNLSPDNAAYFGNNIPREVRSGDSLNNQLTATVHGKLRYTNFERCQFTTNPLQLNNDYPITNWPGSKYLVGCISDPGNNTTKYIPLINYAFMDPMRPMVACKVLLEGMKPRRHFRIDWYNTRVSGSPILTNYAQADPTGNLNIEVPATDYVCRDWAYKVEMLPLKAEPVYASKLTVYPNPTSGRVEVDLGGLVTEEGLLEVINTTGQVVFERKVDQVAQCEIDLSDHPKGVYFLRFTSNHNKQTQKLVLQ